MNVVIEARYLIQSALTGCYFIITCHRYEERTTQNAEYLRRSKASLKRKSILTLDSENFHGFFAWFGASSCFPLQDVISIFHSNSFNSLSENGKLDQKQTYSSEIVRDT